MAMPPMAAPQKTPIGVLILGILTILGGLALVGLGGVLVIAAFFSGASGGEIGSMFGAIFGIVAVIILLFGIIAILAGVGLIRLRSWAWWLAMIVAILGFLASFYSLVTLWYLAALELVIIIYLVVVKKHFGPRPAGM